MNKFLLFFKTIRIVNLLMLALVLFIVSKYFVQDYHLFHYALISFATILIAVAGYLLNDIKDIEIDSVNNKLKLIDDRNKSYWQNFAYLVGLIGLVFGFWASYLSNLYLFLCFVLAALSLLAYAYFLSKFKFIGNILISFLIALSIMLCFYLEVNQPSFSRKYYGFNELNMLVYAGIAFLLNWLRELVKDIEDIEGDKVAGRLTLPNMLGLNSTSFIVGIVLVFFVSIFTILIFNNIDQIMYALYLSSLVFNTLIIIGFLFRSKTTKDFTTVSALIKLLMFLGLLLPIFS